jgi:hypothetical protein
MPRPVTPTRLNKVGIHYVANSHIQFAGGKGRSKIMNSIFPKNSKPEMVVQRLVCL